MDYYLSCFQALKEKIVSPDDQVAKAYAGSTNGIGQAPRQYPELIKNATDFLKTKMASPQHPTTMENLPDELLLNIFIRLLAKQLAQMRSVSKSWNALLSQPSFVKSHLHRSIHHNDQILLVLYSEGYGSNVGDLKPIAAHSCQSPHLELTNFIKLPVNPQFQYKRIHIIGSVNGLICSSYNKESVIQIWNPSLSAVSTLPSYSIQHDFFYHIYFRFGFDPKTDDYKVVKLVGFFDMYIGTSYLVKEWLQVEVYSMKKGYWEFITERFPSHITQVCYDDDVCADGLDGHLHWLAEKMDSEMFIVAFDLGLETFCEIPLPKNFCGFITLGVLEKKLCLMSDKDDVCEVWVMEEYGVAESWVKRHVFSQFVGDPVYYRFTTHNECVLVDDERLVLYDPIADKAKIFEEFCSDEYDLFNFTEYVDGLVWVEPAN